MDFEQIENFYTGSLLTLTETKQNKKVFWEKRIYNASNALEAELTSVQVYPSELRLIPNSNASNAITGTVIDTQHPALRPFHAVRLVLANYDTSAAMTINGICAAGVSANASNNGTGLAWVDGLMDGVNTSSTPFSIPAATTSGGQVRPTIRVTDVIDVFPVARTDVSNAPLLLRTRVHASTGKGLNGNGGEFPNYNNHASNPGLYYANGLLAGASSTLKTASITPTNAVGPSNPIVVIGVIYYYDVDVPSITVFGDSLFQGVGDPAGTFAGWPSRLAWSMATTGRPISCVNYAMSGQTIEDSYATAIQVLSQTQPRFAAWKPWSPNNLITTQALADEYWQKTLNFVDMCLKKGIVPIVLTSPTVNALSTVDYNRLVALNNKVLGLPSTVIKVNLANEFNNGEDLAANINSGDGTHLTAYAHNRAAELVKFEVMAYR